jgi:predicted amino acid-binding ACT domain protein
MHQVSLSPSFRSLLKLGAQVFIDQCIHHPFMYFPAFYCIKELVMHDKPNFSMKSGCLAEYRRNMKEDLLALWKLWVPLTVINFAFMPMYARIPFAACVSLVWTCILSAMRGGDIAHVEDMVGGAVTGASLTMMEEALGELFTSPVELDRYKQHVMITASGHDKPGLVAHLSRAVADAGGNVTHSRMTRLGSDFIMMMHVSVEPEQFRPFVDHMKGRPELKDLTVKCSSLSRRTTGTYQEAAMGVRVHCVGADK